MIGRVFKSTTFLNIRNNGSGVFQVWTALSIAPEGIGANVRSQRCLLWSGSDVRNGFRYRITKGNWENEITR